MEEDEKAPETKSRPESDEPHTPRADRRERVAPRDDRRERVAPRDDRRESVAPRDDRRERVAPRDDRDERVAPRDDRDEPDRGRPSSRVGPSASEGRPDSGGDRGHGDGQHSSGHDRGGDGHRGGGSDQEPTPGMVILTALRGMAEPASMPSAANKDEGRIRALLREVVDAVWATNPTARGQAAVRLEITEETLPETTIDLAMKDGELLVTITTGAPEVERFLADHVGELRDRLASRLRGRSVRVKLARAGRSEAAGAALADGDGPERSAGDHGE
jgi:hypothetical protein